MNEISNHLPFSEQNIDIQNYTMNILALCSEFNLITNEKASEIQSELYSTFVETAEQYTSRASSTISQKRAQLIYSSILYQADAFLLNLNSTEKAVKMLLTVPMQDILKQGKEQILQLYSNSPKIFKRAYINRLNLPLYEYNYVCEKAFDDFFKNYSARFDARNICTSIDYPLLDLPAYSMKSQGVIFICEYYTKLGLENEFCNFFSKFEILHTLELYGKIYKCNYTDLLFNIAEVILNNFLVAAILKKVPFELKISVSDIESIENFYYNHTYEQINSDVTSVFSEYYEKLKNPKLIIYLRHYLPKFSKTLFNKIKSKNLQTFIAAE